MKTSTTVRAFGEWFRVVSETHAEALAVETRCRMLMLQYRDPLASDWALPEVPADEWLI